MKILYITAGAAGMYCGSCLRDNALATELIRQGHDVTLLPLYTPTLTDEPNVSSGKTFFGGISVYLEQRSSLFRHTPRWLDKFWDSRFALKAASKRSIAVDPDSVSELVISILKGERGNQAKEIGKLVDWLKTQPPYDVVDMQNSMLIGLARPIKEATRRPVCCTLQGERKDPRRPARHQYERLRGDKRAAPPARERRFHHRLFRARGAGEGLARIGRSLSPAAHAR
jgi:hypothetical protein